MPFTKGNNKMKNSSKLYINIISLLCAIACLIAGSFLISYLKLNEVTGIKVVLAAVFFGAFAYCKKYLVVRKDDNEKSKIEEAKKTFFSVSLKKGFFQKTYENGDMYEGELVNDLKIGKGKIKFKDGTIYEGEFQNDMINGIGKMVYTDGNIYIGEFINGYRQGNGELSYSNGDKYIGEFQNDMPYGNGEMIWRDGNKTSGVWGDGKLIEKKDNK